MRLLLLAPPGAGKGTQGERLAAWSGVRHIAAGDLLRAEARGGGRLGREIAAYQARGDLVPDQIVLDVLTPAVVEAAAGGGYILDGFPRTLPQATAAADLAARLGVASLDGLTSDVAELVGVSDDLDAVARATSAAHDRFGDHVAASRSQPYYLDVTHPEANKGAVARYLSARYAIPPEAIATIGDMPNDVLMFAHSGLSIAMGNASLEVQRAVRRVTASNADEGFASAVERFILPRG